MDHEFAFRGVWCASVTPLVEDLSIDADRFAAHVRSLLEDGCDGVAVFGSTGEGNSFSVRERQAALDALAARAVPMDRVLVGAGACAAADVLDLAAAARDAGAAGLLLHPPHYYKSVSDDGLFAFLDEVVRGMGARPTPIVLYHFPRLAGVGYSPELVARLAAAWPDVVVGIKDSSGDLDRMAALAAALPGFSVLAGTERLLLPLLELGGAGCLTATTNLTSALASRVVRDRRPEDQERLTAARLALEAAPFVAGIKQLLADRTGHDGWTRIRPPLAPASGEVIAQLRTAVAAAPSDVSA